MLKVMENSNDDSIQNTARQALFLPARREVKYEAKAAIDAFFMRFGDVLQASMVHVGTALGFALSSFAVMNLALMVACFFIAGRSNQANHPKVASAGAAPEVRKNRSMS